MKRINVTVEPAVLFEKHRRLFAALAMLLPVSFEARDDDSSPERDAAIVLAATRKSSSPANHRRVPCFWVLSQGGSDLRQGSEAVQFGTADMLAPCLRNRVLREAEFKALRPIVTEAGDEVMAMKAGQPCWVYHPGTSDRAWANTVSLELPVMAGNGLVAEVFQRDHYLGLLPLIHFLKRIIGDQDWQPPLRRASIVIDDPCLSRGSYGCLSFAALAAHAHSHNYHAAIATVPLDSRRVSPRNAALFHESSDRLSLLIHGNDHVSLEMARRYEHTERIAILAQAIQRVSQLERRHSLPVSRIMEPPYGVIDREMMGPLLTLGYEAVLITTLQFLGCNRDSEFSPHFGLEGVACLPGGLCLLPRIRMAPGWETEVILAELLGQPIIVAGHHYDAANGMALFGEIAKTINSLGSVRWSNLTEIARGHYQIRRDGENLSVRLGGRRIRLQVPKGVERITIERPWVTDGNPEPMIVRPADRVPRDRQSLAGAVETIVTDGAREIEIVSPMNGTLDPANVPGRGTRIWSKVRRFLMEARDRAYPFLHPSSRNPRRVEGGHGSPKHSNPPPTPV